MCAFRAPRLEPSTELKQLVGSPCNLMAECLATPHPPLHPPLARLATLTLNVIARVRSPGYAQPGDSAIPQTHTARWTLASVNRGWPAGVRVTASGVVAPIMPRLRAKTPTASAGPPARDVPQSARPRRAGSPGASSIPAARREPGTLS